RKPKLRDATNEEFVKHLSDPNPWSRGTAQRLLVARNGKSAVPLLKQLSQGKEPLGRLHALWTLEGLGALDEPLVLRALADEQPGLRENALVLAERHLPRSTMLQDQIVSLADDADARVRFQAALSIGQFVHPKSEAALFKILSRDYAYRWTRLAVLSSLKPAENSLLIPFLFDFGFQGEITTNKLDVVRELAD